MDGPNFDIDLSLPNASLNFAQFAAEEHDEDDDNADMALRYLTTIRDNRGRHRA